MTTINFPPDLPISAARDEIVDALSRHQVIIVAGETGSGKTTQLPKIALAMGRTRIAHTQPRRIAARAVAERIAEELNTDLGDDVGYQVRFTDRVSDHTRIRIMTDGILLNQIHSDRFLKRYDTIIIDEAHERSLNIDFLLGYLKRILPKRPDLRVIITSATIDPESFAQHFSNAAGVPAPIVTVSGRTYPVDIRYRPLVIERGPEGEGTQERDLFEAIADGVRELRREGPGDILVFLSGESEIRDALDFLSGQFSRGGGEQVEILPLYGRLSASDQHRVFSTPPAGSRRIVLATNVAETSLTVPGITYVIDAGTARISRYSARSKVQHLPIEAISQASAGQRSGRSGRLRPGVAIRLYSEEDFLSRPEYTDPEILRTGLASVILQMMVLRIGDIARFPFLTPPDKRGIRDGLTLLTELGAVSSAERITPVGRAIARLPIEPRFARMLIESRRFGVTDEVRAVVAGLTIQDVRERPEAERGRADQLHARFVDPHGDLLTLLNLWQYLGERQSELSSSAFRRMCRAEFLNYVRVREWMDLVRQLRRAERDLPRGLQKDPLPVASKAEGVHRAILAGLLSRLGVRDDTGPSHHRRKDSRAMRRPVQEYIGSRGTRFVLHPGSVLAKRPPEVVMSVELVETSRLFARGNASIDPEWAEDAAKHLTKRQVSEPRWEKSRGSAVATERVTLFGVPIVTGRTIQYDRVDPAHARELFIRHALVDGEWDSPHAFDRANWQLRRELERLEERTRRRDILATDDVIFEFYDERIPADVHSTRSFEGWWKKAVRTTPKLLHLTRDILLEDSAPSTDEHAFPRVWQFGDQTLKLRYRFDPTADDDGVSLAIPLPLLPRVEEADFAKLVPGLREELVAGLIRSLPKTIRKHVVPANDWAKRLLKEVEPALEQADSPPLQELLAHAIRRHTSMPVTAHDFDFERLPKHLKPTFKVIDERGRTLGSSKRVQDLQETFKDRVTGNVASVAARATKQHGADVERSNLTSWDIDELPRVLETRYDSRGQAGVVRAYPAIIDRKKHVDIKLVASPDEQRRLTRLGIRRLLTLSSPSPASYIRDHLTNQEKLLLGAGPYPTLDAAITDVMLAYAEQVITGAHPDGLVWTRTEFNELADSFARGLIDEIYRGIALLATVLNHARDARKAIESVTSLHTLGQVKDATAQLNHLIFDGFVSRTGLIRLERFPTYLRAISLRMHDLAANPGRDRTRQLEVERVEKAYIEAGGAFPIPADLSDALSDVRWRIEELRVSLFAQQLGTAERVSTQRILRDLSVPQP